MPLQNPNDFLSSGAVFAILYAKKQKCRVCWRFWVPRKPVMSLCPCLWQRRLGTAAKRHKRGCLAGGLTRIFSQPEAMTTRLPKVHAAISRTSGGGLECPLTNHLPRQARDLKSGAVLRLSEDFLCARTPTKRPVGPLLIHLKTAPSAEWLWFPQAICSVPKRKTLD
jgi:hypothetical protein